MKDIKRIVSTGFWNDDKVLNDFSPEDKYFMLYLLTNPYTTQLGIYHLPIKKVSLEMGYSLESVMVLLDRFERKYKIIRYNQQTSEVAIKNYLRYSIVRGGKPVIDCLEKELKSVKDISLVGYVFNNIKSNTVDITDTVIEFVNNNINMLDTYNDNEKENDNDNDNDNERNVPRNVPRNVDKDDFYELSKKTRFVPPTIEEVEQYCFERNNGIDPEEFVDFYTSKGWYVGKTKMKDWKASVRTWEKNNKTKGNKKSGIDWDNV